MRRLEIGGLVLELTDEQVGEARRQLGVSVGSGKVDIKTAAGILGVSVDFMYDHATEYGGEKHGSVWRFDPETLATRKTVGDSSAVSAPRRRQRRPRQRGQLLEVRGEKP